MKNKNNSIYENSLEKIGTIKDIIRNDYMMYVLISRNSDHHLLNELFKQVNKGIKDKSIKEEDLEFFRSGKLIDAIVKLYETTEVYGRRKPYPAERLFKLSQISTIKDLDTLIVSYTHPSIINAICNEGNFDDRTELTYFLKDGTYNKLPEKVQMAIISEVLKKGNVEIAQNLLETSVPLSKTYKTKNNYVR